MREGTLHHFVTLMDKWKHNNSGKEPGSIVFRNNELLTNVFWTPKSFNTIHKHPKGAEQLPDTIEHPDSVWSLWADPHTQRVVLRNYIKDNYVVKTQDGIIQDAYLVDNTERFKKGVLIYQK